MQNKIFKKVLVVGIFILFICISIIPVTGNIDRIQHISIEKEISYLIEDGPWDTLYVGGSGPGNYSKIQDAIDNASTGFTIFIYNDSSPYYENVYLDKKYINLIGEDTNTTVVDAGGGSSETGWGLVAHWATGSTICNLTIRNCTTIYGTNFALFLMHSNNMKLINCCIRDSIHGLELFYSRNTFMRNNRIENNSMNFGISGWNTYADFYNDIDTSNTVNGKPMYNFVEQDEFEIDGIDAGWLGLISCQGVTVKNINISGNLQNILVINSKACEIRNVTSQTSYYSQHAIQMGLGSNYITIRDCPSLDGVMLGEKNTLKNCNLTFGVSLDSYNEIDSCNIDLRNKKSGVYSNIFLHESSYNTISNCTIHNRTSGEGGAPAVACYLNFFSYSSCSNNNRFINNTFRDCKRGGIEIGYNCNNNTITGNRFINCSNTYDGAGIYISDLEGTQNNIIYNNSFINNTINAYSDSSNIWNDYYPDGGNYWDDYSGIDIYKGFMQDIPGPDGIGDTPYDIPGDGDDKDNYPLMYPWNKSSPAAYFTYKLNNFTIFFNASLSYDPDGTIISYDWDFGDGTNGNGMIINHTYSEKKKYMVTLTVTNDEGLQGNYSKWFNINNKTPYIPGDPIPVNGSINVDINANLSWNCSDPDGDNLTYDVYFEINDPTPDILVSNNQSGNWYDPGKMFNDRNYYWQIVAWDDWGASTSGPIWNFTTEANTPPYPPSNPNPSDNSTGVDVNADLSWECSDPDGDIVKYDVYFGVINPPPKVMSNQSEKFYDPGTMEGNTVYFWQIIAWDYLGSSSSGPVWSFTTGDKPNDPPYVPSNPNPSDDATDIDVDIDLSWTGGDPDPDDTVFYDVYLEAGNPNPSIKIADDLVETVFDPGTLLYGTVYYWQVVARDNHFAMTVGPVWQFTTIENTPPSSPSIVGPSGGKPKIVYDFIFNSIDPEGSDVYYYIRWGDGNFEIWDGPHTSGLDANFSHSYPTPGTFTIKAKARDVFGAESDWSEFEVIITKSKSVLYSFLLRFLERYPLLQKLLLRLGFQ